MYSCGREIHTNLLENCLRQTIVNYSKVCLSVYAQDGVGCENVDSLFIGCINVTLRQTIVNYSKVCLSVYAQDGVGCENVDSLFIGCINLTKMFIIVSLYIFFHRY